VPPPPLPQDEELPFELAMLETGLGEACSFLAREADLLQVRCINTAIGIAAQF